MQVNTDLISDTQAAKAVGVSITTLQRFAEAGYLRIEANATGQSCYSLSELSNIFGINTNTVQLDVGPAPLAEASQTEIDSPKAVLEEITPVVVKPEPVEATEEVEQKVSMPLNTEVERPTPRDNDEAQRLRYVIELQEKILELKDNELKDLRQQRQWLQERIEKLEQKAERDQLLILTETQTVNKLLALQSQRKSPVRLALEWFGLKENASSAGTIEVSQGKAL